jgi:spermidine synthase
MNAQPTEERKTTGCGKAALRTAFVVLGLTAVTVQVLLLRELMVAWRGNEMSFGITLSVWLALVGAGSALYGGLGRRVTASTRALAWGLLALGSLAPIALLVARLARKAMGVSAGELAGLRPLVTAAVASLAPLTLLSGFLFALAVAVLAARRSAPGAAPDRSGTSSPVGEVYVLEAVGAAVGGIVLSFLLLPHWGPVRIALLVTAANGAAALLLTRRPRRSPDVAGPAAPSPVVVVGFVLVGAAVALLARGGESIDEATVRLSWRELGFRAQTNSVYGRVVATELGSQQSVFESGVLVASSPDRLSAEEAVHLPLLSHPSPSRVLLLGGGLGGTVEEIVKHPSVTAVDYVELDPALVRTAEDVFGRSLTAGLNDPRVTVHYSDARFFVKQSETAYDVVIANVPDPSTAQLNRFYTRDFFREVERVLTPGGVLGLSVTSAENYIGEELGRFLACVKGTLGDVFAAVVMTPGDPCHFVAARDGAYLSRDASVLSERILERNLDVVFVRDYYLADRLSPERTASLDESVGRVRAPLNTDLSPAAVYLSMVLWNRQFSSTPALLQTAPRFLNLRNAAVVALALAAALAAPALRRRRRPRALRRTVVAAVFVVGLTEISLEIAALLAFQSLYGFVYHRMAMIVAAFMAGLALGGWLGARAVSRGAGARTFAALQLGICAVPLGLSAAIAGIAGLPHDAMLSWAGLFPLVVVGSAVLAGMQFPLAARLLIAPGGVAAADPGATGGRLYAADLLGSALGASLTAVFLLPVMGIPLTMAALSLVNLAVLASLAVSVLPGRQNG